MSTVDQGDYILHKKVSELTLTQGMEQLQMLEYSELNGPRALTDADRKFRQELEEQEKLLLRDRSRDPKLEDLEKQLADRQAQESHDLALKQTAEVNRLGPSQQFTDRHRQEWEEQTKGFAKERDRYIREFHESQRIVDELREREKLESLKRGDERDEGLGFSR
jgi:hypothetical protein